MLGAGNQVRPSRDRNPALSASQWPNHWGTGWLLHHSCDITMLRCDVSRACAPRERAQLTRPHRSLASALTLRALHHQLIRMCFSSVAPPQTQAGAISTPILNQQALGKPPASSCTLSHLPQRLLHAAKYLQVPSVPASIEEDALDLGWGFAEDSTTMDKLLKSN